MAKCYYAALEIREVRRKIRLKKSSRWEIQKKI